MTGTAPTAAAAELLTIVYLGATRTLGAGITGIGLAILVAGSSGLAGSMFSASSWAPWWVWGTGAIAAGVGVLTEPTRAFGHLAAAAWYAVWGVLLAITATRGDAPLYVVPMYLQLVAMHMLLLILGRRMR